MKDCYANARELQGSLILLLPAKHSTFMTMSSVISLSTMIQEGRRVFIIDFNACKIHLAFLVFCMRAFYKDSFSLIYIYLFKSLTQKSMFGISIFCQQSMSNVTQVKSRWLKGSLTISNILILFISNLHHYSEPLLLELV